MKKSKILFLILLKFSVLHVSCNRVGSDSKQEYSLKFLKEYVNKKGPDFSYEISDSILHKEYKLYHIKMFSGRWLSEEDVNQTLWWHWLDLIVPNKNDSSNALLFVGSGSSKDKKIFLDSLAISQSLKTESIVAYISNVPFQPINFKGSDSISRYEDDLISYGWKKFLSGGAKDEDIAWLARFPMTRAVVRAMDVIQELTINNIKPTDKFFISGASKRGWTTWTTAAVDDRVVGIAPLVIDLLNVVPSFEHHYKAYGDWSPAIQDYVDTGIMDWMGTPAFKRLLDLVEPYQFKEKFTIPKLIVNGTSDEFFLPDSWQFYWDDLPNPKYLQYVPNGNHGLDGGYRVENIYSFYHRIVDRKPLPVMNWKIIGDSIFVDIDTNEPYEIFLWKAKNKKNRDFRVWEIGKSWKKSSINLKPSGKYAVKIPESNGYTASLIEVVFNAEKESSITFTTGTIVRPNKYQYEPYTPSHEMIKIKNTP